MSENSENFVVVTPELLASALADVDALDRRGLLEPLTSEQLAAQLVDNPDGLPELDAAWFDKAFRSRSLKAAE